MAEPILGDPGIDTEFMVNIKQLDQHLVDFNVLKNLSIKTLRDSRRILARIIVDLDYYLSVREDQREKGKN